MAVTTPRSRSFGSAAATGAAAFSTSHIRAWCRINGSVANIRISPSVSIAPAVAAAPSRSSSAVPSMSGRKT